MSPLFVGDNRERYRHVRPPGAKRRQSDRVIAVALALWFGAGLAACDSSGDDDATVSDSETTPTPSPTQPPITGEGQLALTFAMEPDYIPLMDEGEVPMGIFYGAIFYAEDVGSTGPVAGAETLEDIEVAIDLTPNGGPTSVVYTTGELPATELAILGYLDSDGNSPDGDPDDKDPVTLPWDNDDFVVVADNVTTVQVFFGMLNP